MLDRLARGAHDPLAEFPELRRLGRTLEQRVDFFGLVEHVIAVIHCPKAIKDAMRGGGRFRAKGENMLGYHLLPTLLIKEFET
ncbi:hypothetical protein ACFQFQ_03625 [Sulfitobacter porphyrae]|uniref:Uncharacterized protein n=1 Tax=Sulfitobacter porphyrae TaxID=1246864 RepID=A0ABW2B0L1_9RHOB